MAAGDDLWELGCAVTLPLCVKQKRLRRFCRQRQRMIQAREMVDYEAPVLPGYIFAEIPDGLFHDAMSSKHCVGQARALSRADEDDVANLVRRTQRGEFNHNGVYGDLRPGQIMRLLDGMFADVLVTFLEVRGDKLVLEAPMFGQAARFEVGGAVGSIEPLTIGHINDSFVMATASEPPPALFDSE